MRFIPLLLAICTITYSTHASAFFPDPDRHHRYSDHSGQRELVIIEERPEPQFHERHYAFDDEVYINFDHIFRNLKLHYRWKMSGCDGMECHFKADYISKRHYSEYMDSDALIDVYAVERPRRSTLDSLVDDKIFSIKDDYNVISYHGIAGTPAHKDIKVWKENVNGVSVAFIKARVLRSGVEHPEPSTLLYAITLSGHNVFYVESIQASDKNIKDIRSDMLAIVEDITK